MFLDDLCVAPSGTCLKSILLQFVLMFDLFRNFFGRGAQQSEDQIRNQEQGNPNQHQNSGMSVQQVLDLVHNLLAEHNRQYRQDPESYQASADNGQQKGNKFHFKDAGGEDQQLKWRWRRQHGRNHQGQKFLPLKAVADALELGFINALEQKEFATGAAKSKGHNASQRRS